MISCRYDKCHAPITPVNHLICSLKASQTLRLFAAMFVSTRASGSTKSCCWRVEFHSWVGPRHSVPSRIRYAQNISDDRCHFEASDNWIHRTAWEIRLIRTRLTASASRSGTCASGTTARSGRLVRYDPLSALFISALLLTPRAVRRCDWLLHRRRSGRHHVLQERQVTGRCIR